MSRECWRHRLERRWNPSWCCSYSFRSTESGVLFVATTPSSTSKADWFALFGEARGQRALQRGDAASVRGHLLFANKLGVTEAASALQIEVVAALGEQILGPTDVSLSNWTVRPSSGCSVVLATYNLTSPAATGLARPPTSWCTCPRQTTSTIQSTAASWATQGAWSTAKMYFTVPPNGVANLHFGAHFQAPDLPNRSWRPAHGHTGARVF